MKTSRARVIAALLPALALLAAPLACEERIPCTPSEDDCPVDTYCNFGKCEATSIAFPRDAGPHDGRTEWWYYTGHLASPDGRRFGFEVTIFQYDLQGGMGLDSLGYMCHVAVLDAVAGEHYHHDTVSLSPGTWSGAPVVLEVDDCRMESDGFGNDHVVGRIPLHGEKDHKASPWTLDLFVTPVKRVTRHGGDGIIPMAEGGSTSWYYSYTRMDASGTLSTPDGTLTVSGQAWMDHQWGGFDLQEFKGWDWWSLQFDDGREIMLFTFMDWDGRQVAQAGTIVDAEGNAVELLGDADFTITPLRTWDSPHTDGVYPLDWDIVIPRQDWRLEVRTQVDDQEMWNPAQNYWEGATTVTGRQGGKAVSGVGYTELTGYASDFLDPARPE